MALISGPTILTTIKLESTSCNGAPPPHNQTPIGRPLLSLSKPSWVVRTESNVWREKRKKPDPPCVVCKGSGRVDCTHCRGKGRTNEVHLAMLPKGQWPKWCRTCGGSGLGYCSRCLGTGEYRSLMGFQIMNRENNHSQDYKNFQIGDNLGKHRADFLLNIDHPNS